MKITRRAGSSNLCAIQYLLSYTAIRWSKNISIVKYSYMVKTFCTHCIENLANVHVSIVAGGEETLETYAFFFFFSIKVLEFWCT